MKVTEVELVYHNKQKFADRQQITSSFDAYQVLSEVWDEGKIELQEQFKILLLDRKNNVLGVSHISSGGVADCMVDAKLVFATAVKALASGIVLAHNHPSGNMQFSDADRALTRKFCEGAKNLDMQVLDHLVLTSEGYASMSDEGQMPAIHLKL
ncbi:JAB domain-containing protein [Flavobacterium sp.]|uniref:JAB domain-containing protein n=1 Tax=Flavobacterium sp. TaxID=239 RepID=UPI0025C6CCB9|nr:JAB domain-containing protein [Flavobacterium sp.]